VNLSFYTLTASHVRLGNIHRVYDTFSALAAYSGCDLVNHDDVQNVEIKQCYLFSDEGSPSQIYCVEGYSRDSMKYEQMYCAGPNRLVDLLKWVQESDTFEGEPTVTTLQVGYEYKPPTHADGTPITSSGELLRKSP